MTAGHGLNRMIQNVSAGMEQNPLMNINTLIVLVPLGILTPVTVFLAMTAVLFDRTANLSHSVARIWAKALLAASRVKLEVTGAENIDLEGTYIFAVNHSSMFDILVLMAALPVQFRWMAKEELFRIPVLGRGMKACGYIPVNRTNPREGVRSLTRAAEKIKAGSSVIIFPEGTRSRSGQIQEFKRGGFTLAVQSGRPIVPVSISGANRVLPAKSLSVHPGPVKVAIGSPVSTHEIGRDQHTQLMDEVRRAIISGHEPDYGIRAKSIKGTDHD